MSLSRRAEKDAERSTRALIWQVYNDSWEPKTNPDGFVNIGVAENRLMHAALIERLGSVSIIPEHSLTYGQGPKGSRRLRQAVSTFLTRELQSHTPILPEHVIITNGVSSAVEHCAWALTNPGDSWLLGQPHYGAFKNDLTDRFGAELIRVPFGDVDPMSVEAVACYESSIKEASAKGASIKALMLCNPHNPLGRCYSKEALQAYLTLCNRHQIHLVSDEIYALGIWNNQEDPQATPFTSILSFDLDGLIDPSLVHALWGMSKDFGANGVPQSGFALTISTIQTYISGLADHTVAEILEDKTWIQEYMKENKTSMAAIHARTASFLRQHNIVYARGSNAGFFFWVDLGEVYRKHHKVDEGEDLTKTIMDALWAERVFLASGTSFGSEKPGFFRITFTHPWEYLEEGLKRMLKALEPSNATK
ncbi:hypothetical protein CAC42_349 [Sphaceloma murrayae]|uniref:Aminotransferase class I/classII large domain-containing protein n=1 Tax=Sphaceloma murrayae TaxID=2082308 RepID=A0A2K1QZZ7_9PEZI|nr:hypothetical protein CAC42_349 [Sphaceloma murrayae]